VVHDEKAFFKCFGCNACGTIFEYWALLSGIFVGAPFGTFVLGVLTRRVQGSAAFAGMLVGILADIGHYVLYEWGYLHYGSALAMDFYGAAWGFAANVATALLITAFSPAKPDRLEPLLGVWHAARRKPWYRTPEALAALSLAVMIALNWIYW